MKKCSHKGCNANATTEPIPGSVVRVRCESAVWEGERTYPVLETEPGEFCYFHKKLNDGLFNATPEAHQKRFTNKSRCQSLDCGNGLTNLRPEFEHRVIY